MKKFWFVLAVSVSVYAGKGASVKAVGPVKSGSPTVAEAAKFEKALAAGPEFSFRREVDTVMVKGKQRLIPGRLLFTWGDGKGKSLTWDADSGTVVSGDTLIAFPFFVSMSNFWFNKYQEAVQEKKSRDSAASDNIARAWAILNPERRP